MAHEFVASNLVIGVIIGCEGLIALWPPLVVGVWSDRPHTRVGGRLPFLIAGTPVLAVGLLGMAFVASTAAVAITALVFFVGYCLAYEPYRALYPDAVGEEIAAQAQGAQALWRGLGTGLAPLGGGLLLGVGRGAPFLAAALVYIVAIAGFGFALARRGVPDHPRGGLGAEARHLWELVRESGALKVFLIANACWELSLAALKTFVVLYVTRGLGHSRTQASLIIGGVAVIVPLAALAAGKLADRFGRLRVRAAGLRRRVPRAAAHHDAGARRGGGAVTGSYSVSRGIGTWLGPLLAGAAITASGGYQAVWGVCALAVLASTAPVHWLRRHSDE